MRSEVSETDLGKVTIVTTDNRGLLPEEVAEMCLQRITGGRDPSVSEQARAQADVLKQTLDTYMRMAADGRTTTLVNKLRAAGHADIADKLKDL